MLRGAIEVADQSRVSGWIVSSAGQLRGHVIWHSPARDVLEQALLRSFGRTC